MGIQLKLILSIWFVGTCATQTTPSNIASVPRPQFPITFADPHSRMSYKCLIFEVASFNQIDAQFHFRGKTTADDKSHIFAYELQLGDEKYEASGKNKRQAIEVISLAALIGTKHRYPANGIDTCTINYSAVVLVHEWAQTHRRTVSYNVVEQCAGPPAAIVMECVLMPNFVTRGKASDKKTAKLEAAENMLIELRKFDAEGPSAPLSPECAVDMHPVSRLHEITNKNNQPEPAFRLLDSVRSTTDNDTPVYIFIMQVRSGALTATGSGTSVNAAKRDASKNMLKLMHFSV